MTRGVVTGGALVRLMAVIWVVVVMALVVVGTETVVVVEGGLVVVVLTGFSVNNGGLSGFSGRAGGL